MVKKTIDLVMEARLREYRAARKRQETIENAKQKVVSVKSKFSGNLASCVNKVSYLACSCGFHVGKWVGKAATKVDPWIEKFLDYFPAIEWNMESEEETKVLIQDDSKDTTVSDDVTLISVEESWKPKLLKFTLILIVWLMLFSIFVNLEFGAVFFIVSALVGVCLNTRTKPRKKGEMSAYSVFNKNCESIDGTLTAQQFEREIMFGPGALR